MAERAWVAGILEGEGYWTQRVADGRWWVGVRMTDEDIIRRLPILTGIGTVTVDLKPGRPGCKIAWAWNVAVRSHREWLTVQVWPWMGQRRRARIREVWPDIPADVVQRQDVSPPS